MHHLSTHVLIHKHSEGMSGIKHENKCMKRSCSQQEHQHKNTEPRSQTGTGKLSINRQTLSHLIKNDAINVEEHKLHLNCAKVFQVQYYNHK